MENDKIEDPEVQLELDRLNNASEKINELENMLRWVKYYVRVFIFF